MSALFSFDLSSLVTIAGNLFTALAPIIGVVGGILLGIGIFRFLLKEVRQVL